MKTFKQEDDNLYELEVGNVLELEDGTRHKVVKDDGVSISCQDCSIWRSGLKRECPVNIGTVNAGCDTMSFHFELQPDEI